MREYFMKWEEFEKELNLTPEQEAQIKFEMDLINATIQARKKNKLSQRDLSKKTGIAQPVIARIEKYANSPQVNTLLKLLYPLGYTLKVVPFEKEKK